METLNIKNLQLDYKGAFPTFSNGIGTSIKSLSLKNTDWKLEDPKDDYSDNLKALTNLESLGTRLEYNFDFSNFPKMKEVSLDCDDAYMKVEDILSRAVEFEIGLVSVVNNNSVHNITLEFPSFLHNSDLTQSRLILIQKNKS